METKPGYPDDDRCRLTQKASGDFSFWDPSNPDAEVTLTPEMLGVPSEIKIVPPNIPNIKILHDLPTEIKLDPNGIPPEIHVTWSYQPPKAIDWIDLHIEVDETQQIRKAIIDCLMQLPEHKTDLNIPRWIGSPPLEEIIKVKGKIVQDMAYYDWEKAGKPEGKDNDFWFTAEKRFDNALNVWF